MNVLKLAMQEVRAGLRNRWVVATTLLLAALSLSTTRSTVAITPRRAASDPQEVSPYGGERITLPSSSTATPCGYSSWASASYVTSSPRPSWPPPRRITIVVARLNPLDTSSSRRCVL